ncbi:MAG TPA: MBL fold metallo-hydrolase [Porphyromonadaceae bacterium]|nr:MBL fold metallo-hydrolase [Porphyromonadaceae bacterium]
MKVQFLGTGTSTGVPQIGCHCAVCRSTDMRDKRLRASVRIEVKGKVLVIDCTPDFRQQMLSLPFAKIDGMLFTHEHYDHVGGIDDLRPFSVFGSVELFMEEQLEHTIRERMPYCFAPIRYGGVPDITIRRISDKTSFFVDGVEVIPIRVMHYKLPILGYRIGDFVYLTDVKTIPETEFEKLKDVDTLVISALRKKEHISHQTLQQALQMVNNIRPKKAYFTHMSHEMGLHEEVERELPPHVMLAHDGLEITL